MKTLRGVLVAALGALAVHTAWGAVEIDERVAYLQAAQPDDRTCPWEADMVSSAVTRSKGFLVRAEKPQKEPGAATLSLSVARLSLTRKTNKGEYLAVVRGDMVRNGKLIATHDFQDDKSFKNDQTPCEALRALGTSLGNEVSDWVAKTPLMECGDECAGIHPDETIVTGAEILLGAPDAINATVRDECGWPKGIVNRLLAAYNEIDEPPLRAKLEARSIDIENYPGRRLVLHVKEVHALGGGGFSGPKWMSLSGELREGKTLVASFDSFTTSGRGLTTCRSVDSLSDSSVDMIVDWLRNPRPGAQLK